MVHDVNDLKNLPVLTAINPATGEKFSYINLTTLQQAECLFNEIKLNVVNQCADILKYADPNNPKATWDWDFCYMQIKVAFFKTVWSNIVTSDKTYGGHISAPSIYINLPDNITADDLIRLGFRGFEPDNNSITSVCLIPRYLKDILYPLLQIESIDGAVSTLGYLKDTEHRKGFLMYGLRVPNAITKKG